MMSIQPWFSERKLKKYEFIDYIQISLACDFYLFIYLNAAIMFKMETGGNV